MCMYILSVASTGKYMCMYILYVTAAVSDKYILPWLIWSCPAQNLTSVNLVWRARPFSHRSHEGGGSSKGHRMKLSTRNE